MRLHKLVILGFVLLLVGGVLLIYNHQSYYTAIPILTSQACPNPGSSCPLVVPNQYGTMFGIAGLTMFVAGAGLEFYILYFRFSRQEKIGASSNNR